MSNKLTATTHPVDFNHLSPQDFSKLCFWFVEDSGEYENVEFYDGPGDKQRDVIGYINDEDIHYYQCKRYKSISYSDIKSELEDIEKHISEDEIPFPKRLYFVSSVEVSPKAKDQSKKLCGKLNLPELAFWGPVILDKKIKANPNALKNFFNIEKSENTERPILDLEGLVSYGTTDYSFTVVNNGKTKAVDVKWQLLGFGFNYLGTPTVFSLESGAKKELKINLSGDFMKKIPIKELRLRFYYRDSEINKYYSERLLNIEEVNSGAFFRIAAEAGIFIPPQKFAEVEINSVESLPRDGARYGYAINYNYDGQARVLDIFISHSLVSVFDFSEDAIKAAIRELGEKKIAEMIKTQSFIKRIDLNTSMLEESLQGFEAYKYMRSKF
jgi:hypothetical protein